MKDSLNHRGWVRTRLNAVKHRAASFFWFWGFRTGVIKNDTVVGGFGSKTERMGGGH